MASPNNEKVDYQGAQCLIPELHLIGYCIKRRASNTPLVAHSHPKSFEIFYFEQGHINRSANGKSHDIGSGDLFFLHPGETHGSYQNILPCKYYWIQFRAQSKKALPGLSSESTQSLYQALNRIHHRVYPAGIDIPFYLQHLFYLHQHRPPFAQVQARATLHLIMVALIQEHQLFQDQQHQKRQPSFQIQKALDWIERNLQEAISLPQLAKITGLSIGHFRTRFHQETGSLPADYLSRRRVIRAAEILRKKSIPITQLSHELGFSSSQYFATVFRKYHGMSPRDFLARNGRSNH